MHLIVTETVSLDDTVAAVDLGMISGELLFLSYTDSDLTSVRKTHGDCNPGFSLAAASLARLKHPLSVDLMGESLAAKARFIVARVLGGMDAWRYGIEELGRIARAHRIPLAVVPGCTQFDPRLVAISTVAEDDWARIWGWFQGGGLDNLASFTGFVGKSLGYPANWAEPVALSPFGRVSPASLPALGQEQGRAALICYRSLVQADDIAPLVALAEALAERGLATETLYVTSLKDAEATSGLMAHLDPFQPDILINTTAFSARLDDGTTVLDRLQVPHLQAFLSIDRREAWAASKRGLGATDLAMNIVLPEIDGRIPTRAISFKAEIASENGEIDRVIHQPDAGGVAAVADLARNWVRLRKITNADKKIAIIVPDYPGRGGRGGRAVGLDTAASVIAICNALKEQGYSLDFLPGADQLMAILEGREKVEGLELQGLSHADYRRVYAGLPEDFRADITATWGPPPEGEGAFQWSVAKSGNIVIGLQPDRGDAANRDASYHDPNLPPSHSYVAFHLWLKEVIGIDALVQLGTHGTLEWTPGKSVALSETCAPSVLTGAVPVLYPFIVNNPGEAAHCRRRLSAITIGHMTPPLTNAGHHGATAELETLMDEYANARILHPHRARLVARTILTRAAETGLAQEAGIVDGMGEDDALSALDGWLCDLKEMRIGDGLHIFGSPSRHEDFADVTDAACGGAEIASLINGLSGHFIPPGPSGAPTPSRRDVLPTGRNLYAVDPRAIPTPTAYAIGKQVGLDILTRYAQDHGDWPKALVLDLWGSSTMRTGGEDFAQALSLMGVKPVWDAATGRVTGFTVLPPAMLDHPRIDVTLRISGLFRDCFAEQIALFDRAVSAVAALDEPDETNPLAASARATSGGRTALIRIFGTAPGAYGTGLGGLVNSDQWQERSDLGAAYLASSSHGYGIGIEGEKQEEAFAARLRSADALVHVEDLAGRDVLDHDAYAEHEGGFAAAAASLGGAPVLYHADTSSGGRAKVRTLSEEVARVVRARATNPKWIAGQMRHGHRGAAEIAETIDNFYALGVTAAATRTDQFDLLFDATLGDPQVRSFLETENPHAIAAMAETFRRAARRGLWQDRRNSTASILAELAEPLR